MGRTAWAPRTCHDLPEPGPHRPDMGWAASGDVARGPVGRPGVFSPAANRPPSSSRTWSRNAPAQQSGPHPPHTPSHRHTAGITNSRHTDRYVRGTRLRLRRADFVDSRCELKLTRKGPNPSIRRHPGPDHEYVLVVGRVRRARLAPGRAVVQDASQRASLGCWSWSLRRQSSGPGTRESCVHH